MLLSCPLPFLYSLLFGYTLNLEMYLSNYILIFVQCKYIYILTQTHEEKHMEPRSTRTRKHENLSVVLICAHHTYITNFYLEHCNATQGTLSTSSSNFVEILILTHTHTHTYTYIYAPRIHI